MKGALSDSRVEEDEGSSHMHGKKDTELTPILEANQVLWMCRVREKGMEGAPKMSSGVIRRVARPSSTGEDKEKQCSAHGGCSEEKLGCSAQEIHLRC